MKVYIPTMEELEQLQALGVNVYSYIITKTVETIIMEDKVYDNGNMFEILDYLGPHPEIIYAICRLYPAKIKESLITSKDTELAVKLLSKLYKEDRIIYGLDDYLMNLDESILFDEGIIKTTINTISRYISSCPKYRFDYMGPNELLDSIFACELPNSKITPESHDGLIMIDPIYSVKLDIKSNSKIDRMLQNIPYQVQRGMAIYTGRYGIDEHEINNYSRRDIINKPDDNVKRLIKCLEYHKKHHQY